MGDDRFPRSPKILGHLEKLYLATNPKKAQGYGFGNWERDDYNMVEGGVRKAVEEYLSAWASSFRSKPTLSYVQFKLAERCYWDYKVTWERDPLRFPESVYCPSLRPISFREYEEVLGLKFDLDGVGFGDQHPELN